MVATCSGGRPLTRILRINSFCFILPAIHQASAPQICAPPIARSDRVPRPSDFITSNLWLCEVLTQLCSIKISKILWRILHEFCVLTLGVTYTLNLRIGSENILHTGRVQHSQPPVDDFIPICRQQARFHPVGYMPKSLTQLAFQKIH